MPPASGSAGGWVLRAGGFEVGVAEVVEADQLAVAIDRPRLPAVDLAASKCGSGTSTGGIADPVDLDGAVSGDGAGPWGCRAQVGDGFVGEQQLGGDQVGEGDAVTKGGGGVWSASPVANEALVSTNLSSRATATTAQPSGWDGSSAGQGRPPAECAGQCSSTSMV